MTTTPALSPAKRRAFTAAMLLLPLLLLGLTEGALRLVGYGDDYPLFVRMEEPPDVQYQNRQVARRYFANQAQVPNSLLDFFAADKDSAGIRVFVQGGSSAAGYPFYHGGAFSRMLEQRLLQTFPDRPVEVVNTAMAAVNSYTLLDLADEIIAEAPDAVLIYAGHNEYYGALGVGSSESLGRTRALVKAYLAVQELRLTQALRAGLSRAAGLFAGRTAGEAPGYTLMERMVGEQSIPYGSALYRQGLDQFRGNLRELLARYERAGIPVFIGTVASNERDHPPFVNGLAPETDEAAWRADYEAGLAAAARGDTAAALERLGAAVARDTLAALPYFARARLHDAAGRTAEARADYLAAKDRDQLRFRAPEAVNAVIREEAARHGAVVVETREALAAASPDGIIGGSLMTEHLHPNVDGYFVIADAFYHALRNARALGDWSRPVPTEVARQEVLLTPIDSLVGTFRVRQLMGSWPFQPPGVVDRSLDTLTARDPVEQMALDVYRDEVAWRDAVNTLRDHYETQGDYRGAMQAALALVQEYPFLDTPYLAAGNILIKQQRYDEALAYFEAALERRETPAAHRMIGSIVLARGDLAAATPHLERAVALDPQDQGALYNLSGAYARAGDYARSRTTVEKLLRLAPDHAAARRLLNSLPPPAQAAVDP